MKNTNPIRVISIFCIFLSFTIILSGCSHKDNENFVTTEYSSENETINITDNNTITIDESWKTNYVLKYSFYDNKQGTSEISECCNGTDYVSIDSETGIVTYITPGNGYLIQYFLNPSSNEGTMSFITGNGPEDLQSGFYLISVADKKLPLYSNTKKVGTSVIAGRQATQYTQTGISDTTNDNMTAVIYVDNQYGFVSKCELYDSSRKLMMSWELQYFSADADIVNQSMPKIDLSTYSITSSEQ